VASYSNYLYDGFIDMHRLFIPCRHRISVNTGFSSVNKDAYVGLSFVDEYVSPLDIYRIMPLYETHLRLLHIMSSSRAIRRLASRFYICCEYLYQWSLFFYIKRRLIRYRFVVTLTSKKRKKNKGFRVRRGFIYHMRRGSRFRRTVFSYNRYLGLAYKPYLFKLRKSLIANASTFFPFFIIINNSIMDYGLNNIRARRFYRKNRNKKFFRGAFKDRGRKR